MFALFPVELVRLSTLLHQEFSLLFVPLGSRLGFLPQRHLNRGWDRLPPGNEWLQGRAH